MTASDPFRSRGGAAPFGYRWKQGRLVPDENEAPVRRLMFDLFLKHRRKKTVARILNDLGYRTRNKAEFSDMAVDRLLRDPTAKGVRIEGGTQVSVEAVVSVEIWERANLLLRARENKRSANPFVGRLTCSCGSSMTVPSNSDKYVCTGCKARIPANDLEFIFVSQIGSFEFGEKKLQDIWPKLSESQQQRIIEQLCEKIIVARESISIRFACDTSLFKTNTLGQHLKGGNEPSTAESAIDPSPTELSEPLMSETDAASFLGISKMTLLRKRKEGLVGFFRIGFRILYSKEKHLVPYLAACEVRKPN